MIQKRVAVINHGMVLKLVALVIHSLSFSHIYPSFLDLYTIYTRRLSALIEKLLKMDKRRALILCYPDEPDAETSKGLAYLEAYQGNTVIHIGELFGQTLSDDAW
jgi:hypothetical protein